MDIDATANLVAPAPVLATVLSSNVKDADQVLELKSTTEMDNAHADAKVKVESKTPTPTLKIKNNDGVPPVKQEENYDDDTEEDDEEDDKPTTLCDLMEVLNDIDTPGSTCAAGPAKDLPPLLGLHIEGVGDIPLPISDV